MSKLEKADPHHWGPIPEIVMWLTNRLPADAKVLEIGPGTAPFRRADAYVDFVDVAGIPSEKMHKCDIATEKLPFEDKSFDFVVCRHTLEDMYNPFPICAEMSRVAKAGYVETPSPIAEMCRGVDGNAPPYRGYHHHRFMIWECDGILNFVSKYPLVEYLQFDEDLLVRLLKGGARYWNTYCLWTDKINVKHNQSPLDFDIWTGYPRLISDAVRRSVRSTDDFCAPILQQAAA